MDQAKMDKAFKRFADRADFEIRQIDIGLSMAQSDAKVSGANEEELADFMSKCRAYVNDRVSTYL